GLNYIAGKRMHKVNNMAELGTILAHIDGGVPNIGIKIPKVTEMYLGQLIYFFEMACALSGYILGINPFNQPGVEAYKKNMFAFLQTFYLHLPCCVHKLKYLIQVNMQYNNHHQESLSQL
ncbi:MAG: hypothetical protein ISS18_11455, partial [Bacteroidales bacterium]|nr:hypothetical protein [Bacteroidales bacterium]